MQEQLDATTGGKKLSFAADQRCRLATAGKQLTPDERRKCCRLVKPETILTWFRQLAAKKYDSSEVGHPSGPRAPGYYHAQPARRAFITIAARFPVCVLHGMTIVGSNDNWN